MTQKKRRPKDTKSKGLHGFLVEIGTPPAPALLADSLTSTSLSLEWEVPDHLSNIMKRRKNVLRNYLVQWRYEESGNDWKYYRNQSMEDSTTIRVENLQPYTKYRVSVNFEMLFLTCNKVNMK